MIIVGHRGALGHATENSLEGFEIAFAAGVDAIELDVKTIHNRLVVFHDDVLDRVTQATGSIYDLSEKHWRHVRLHNGEPIPMLEDVWDITPPSILMNVELKGPETAAPFVAFARTHAHRYLVSSFLMDELETVRELDADIPLAVLTREADVSVLKLAKELKAQNIHVYDPVAEAGYLRELRVHGFNVLVFSVNDLNRAKQLWSWGVHGIFTDIPRDLVRFFDNER